MVKFQHNPSEKSGTPLLSEVKYAAANVSGSEISMVLHFLHHALSEPCLLQSKCCRGTEACETGSAALAHNSKATCLTALQAASTPKVFARRGNK